MLRLAIGLGSVVLLCGSAAAHDFWLQPASFTGPVAAPVSTTIQVGHGPARQRSPIRIERVTAFHSIGPDGDVDRRAELHPGAAADDATLSFAVPGTYVVAFETNYTTTNLPAIRFNDYLAAEGLSAVSEWRVAHGTAQQPGRELYSRRAKMVIEIGDADSADSAATTTALGLSLEIVPAVDPSKLHSGDPLPLGIIYDGKALPGAQVKLIDLAKDETPVAIQRTDTAGQTTFAVPYPGQWLLNVTWSVPAPGNPEADFLTTFSSLSFASR